MASKQFSNTKEIVYQLLEKLLELKHGQTYIETFNSKHACDNVRAVLYRELKRKGIGRIFVIKRVSETILSLTRTVEISSSGALAGQDKDLETFIITHLLEVYEELEAFTVIREGLPQHLWGTALDEWKRIVGEAPELC